MNTGNDDPHQLIGGIHVDHYCVHPRFIGGYMWIITVFNHGLLVGYMWIITVFTNGLLIHMYPPINRGEHRK
jgi:hypothetical protein